jgi:predicted ester cyclase
MSTTALSDKRRVHAFSTAIADTTPQRAASTLREHVAHDVRWDGPAPIGVLEGVSELADGFWRPLLDAFPDLERNEHILIGGRFEDADWVMTTGNMVGTFERDWLGIPATGHATWLHYVEFHELVGDEIVRTNCFVDVLDVMRQAGYRVVPALAPERVAPGPSTQDGVLLDEQEPAASDRTRQLVEEMIFEGLHSYEEDEGDHEVMGVERYFHEDFMYYAPCGIGTTRGIDGFEAYMQHPFLEAFPDRKGGDHEPRIADGSYCASTGPVTATHTGSGWLGLPATGTELAIPVVDIWRREGEKIAENWLFMDLVDVFDQLGIDVFERLERGQVF